MPSSAQPKPVAYFLVDAMRYEMGVELVERLPASTEATITPAVAALPSITPVGMAALMPGAAASFDVVDSGGKLGSRIDGTFLPDLTARRKFAEAAVPGLVDLTLAELLGTSAKKLESKLSGAQVVIVRSQEIDAAGEGGFFQARRTMDTVIDDLVRAIKKLSSIGVKNAVVSADHGHLFGHADREEAMRVDAPGGATVDLHRRCWIGRGGTTPPGAIRVSAPTLGYDSDLDFVFPPGTAVFKAGGDLGFHHGGPTLQELIVPVVTVRTAAPAAAPKGEPVTVTGVPARDHEPDLQRHDPARRTQPWPCSADRRSCSPCWWPPAARWAGWRWRSAPSWTRRPGTLVLSPGTPVNVGVHADRRRRRVHRVWSSLDPATDAELYRSPHDIPVNLGVA